MLWHDPQHAREHRLVLGGLLLLLLRLLQVGFECVEEVVDDVGAEDLHAHLLGELLGLFRDGHVKGQDDAKLLGLAFDHDVGAHHVLLVNRADGNRRDWDLDVVGLQKLEERLEGAQGGRLHADALARLVDRAEDVLHVLHDLVFYRFNVVILAHDEQLGPGDGVLEPVGGNLDARRGAELLVRDVAALDSDLAQRLWGEQRSDLGDDWSVQTAHDNGVAFLDLAVDEDDVDGGPETLDLLDLQDGALQVRHEHELLDHECLGHLDEDLHQVRDTLARDGGRRHDVDKLPGVLVLPVEGDVETLLVELQGHLRHPLLELLDALGLLAIERVHDGRVLDGVPLVDAVDLVHRDDERRLAHLEQVDGLDSLLLKAVHQINDEHSDVAQTRSPGTEVREGLVPGRVDDQQAGQLEVKLAALAELLGTLHECVGRDIRGTNLLGDTARLPVLHVGTSDVVQDLGLSRVDVPQDAADRRAKVLRVPVGECLAQPRLLFLALGEPPLLPQPLGLLVRVRVL